MPHFVTDKSRAARAFRRRLAALHTGAPDALRARVRRELFVAMAARA